MTTRCEGCRKAATAIYRLPQSGAASYMCEICAEKIPGAVALSFLPGSHLTVQQYLTSGGNVTR